MSSPSGAWYKSPMVWFILAILATAVTASLYTVHLAWDAPNDLLPHNVGKFAIEEKKDEALPQVQQTDEKQDSQSSEEQQGTPAL
ncbi:MAG: hypothetical protein VX185_02755 [Pseudomonadota bacterium]|nr:hypothetical protein [Gammaproteobacteria bacterium]MEC8009665.1 hypothetical protein [Pseudomonadota bacterium]HBF06842.1 hypothetical protein [Gammaproteobacteria bacterium]|tara:strand:- start:190 stop:444 length:255 start_codon:yes stop_codon:yes gene_type:complete